LFLNKRINKNLRIYFLKNKNYISKISFINFMPEEEYEELKDFLNKIEEDLNYGF
jgi:hypothetical protein